MRSGRAEEHGGGHASGHTSGHASGHTSGHASSHARGGGSAGAARVTAVIMAGGKGERLWPRSRAALPKQFVQLAAGGSGSQGGRTLIQATVDRICPLVALEDTFVVTGSEWAGLVSEQLPEIPPENVIIEPVARNTAPCIALATFIIRQRYRGEDPVMVVLPADHVIRDDEAFRSALQAAVRVAVGVADGGYRAASEEEVADGAAGAEVAEATAGAEVAAGAEAAAAPGAEIDPAGAEGAAAAEVSAGTPASYPLPLPLPYPLVTLGIWPTRPETGYGYIKIGRLLGNIDVLSVYEAAQFTEKPGAVVAQHFVASGRYLWNSGMFIWRASTIWEAFRRYMPEVYGTLARVEAMATAAATASATSMTAATSAAASMTTATATSTSAATAATTAPAKPGGTATSTATSGAAATSTASATSMATPTFLPGARAAGALAAPGPAGPSASDSPGDGWSKAFDEVYRQLRSISIDYAIMEKARPIITIPCSFGWDDVGSWPALERLLPGDEHGNVVGAGKCVVLDTRNCIVSVSQDREREVQPGRGSRERGQEASLNGERHLPRLIALFGVEDLVVVDTENVLHVPLMEENPGEAEPN
ncbi:MAG TPA: mannose-1-phosphate guanylyltransferase [Firmicutes bacterium]|nr:mannose-1-phosphate guanylyltransferase [Bacillota bacterium]